MKTARIPLNIETGTVECHVSGFMKTFLGDGTIFWGGRHEVLETKFKHSPKLLAREKEYIGKCTVRVVPKIKLDVVTGRSPRTIVSSNAPSTLVPK